MRYKTLFRLGLKLIGVAATITSGGGLLSSLWLVLSAYIGSSGMNFEYAWNAYAGYIFLNTCGVLLGLYFFFGGKWVADLAIPSNRPYCHECGYDLTAATGHICNECGTAFRSPNWATT
ncbi:MAG TPA: hypothetical protein PLD59_15200 [Tepidisphaeraceae bacterium]|nr:hypothetical protein [Tepidisphaeraceae bacterium]